MVDVTAIGGVLTSTKAAYEIAKGLIGIRDSVVIQGKVAELLREIMAAQESALRSQEREFALTREIHELKQRIAETEAWDREKDRYQLTELPPGVFVYTVKEDACGQEPPHKLCPNCFEQRKRSVLQGGKPVHGVTTLHCLSCGAEIQTGVHRPPPINSGRGGGNWMA